MRSGKALLRREKRYSHIMIGLHCGLHGSWHAMQAHDWHKNGFNFYNGFEIAEQELVFRKGILKFSGQVAWCRKSDDDAVLHEHFVNEALFRQIKKLASSLETAHRIANLIRTNGRIEEKRKLLAHAGAGPGTDEEIAAKIAAYKQTHQTWRYGIKVEDTAWEQIVRVALETSSVILALEKVGQSLSAMKP